MHSLVEITFKIISTLLFVYLDIYNFTFLDAARLLLSVNKCFPIFHCLQLQ